MRYVVMMSLLVLGLSGCFLAPSRSAIRQEEQSLPSIVRSLDRPAGAVGIVPLQVAFDLLRQGEVIDSPPINDGSWIADRIPISGTDRLSDVLRNVESATLTCYDPVQRKLVRAMGTHGVDSPDPAGRATSDRRLSLEPRSSVVVGIRFRRLAAGVDFTPLSITASGEGRIVWCMLPQGVRGNFNAETERGYQELVRDTQTGTSLPTTRQVVPAGISMSVLASWLPGNRGRIDGSLTLSSFTGDGVDRASISCPVQVDADRRKWIMIFRGSAIDGRVKIAMQGLGLDVAGSGEDFVVEVMVL